jgi:hypothetical protein
VQCDAIALAVMFGAVALVILAVAIAHMRRTTDEPANETPDVSHAMPPRYDINMDPAPPIAEPPNYDTGYLQPDDDGWPGVYL